MKILFIPACSTCNCTCVLVDFLKGLWLLHSKDISLQLHHILVYKNTTPQPHLHLIWTTVWSMQIRKNCASLKLEKVEHVWLVTDFLSQSFTLSGSVTCCHPKTFCLDFPLWVQSTAYNFFALPLFFCTILYSNRNTNRLKTEWQLWHRK